jgi:hypothetical protein
MCLTVFVSLLCSLVLLFAGCKKPASIQPSSNSQPTSNQESNQPQIDVCGLLTKEEIEAIQGSLIKEATSSAHSDAGFLVSQCFYTATEFSKSVSLAIVQRDPGGPATTSPRDFWKERFGRYSGDEKERDKVKEETEHNREKKNPFYRKGSKASAKKPSGPATVSAVCFML